MKKTQQILSTITILIILTFFISPVSADVTFDTPPKHMYTGDSITVGIGGTYTNPSGTYTGVAGYRDNLQDLFGLWQPQIVGDKLDRPENNLQLIGYHQPRHFGWPGDNSTKWLERITTSPQQHITWFSDPNPKNLIVIFIGSNDALQRGWAGPDDASELLAVAPIESYIDTLIAFDDTINSRFTTLQNHIFYPSNLHNRIYCYIWR